MMLGADGFLLTAKAYLSKHPAPRAFVLCLCPVTPGYAQADSLLAQRFVPPTGIGSASRIRTAATRRGS